MYRRIANIDHFIKIALYSIDTIVVLSQNLTSFLRLHSLFWFLRHHQHLSRRHYTLTLHKVFYIYLRTMPPNTEIIFAQFMSMRETQILARALKIQNHSDNKIKWQFWKALKYKIMYGIFLQIKAQLSPRNCMVNPNFLFDFQQPYNLLFPLL